MRTGTEDPLLAELWKLGSERSLLAELTSEDSLLSELSGSLVIIQRSQSLRPTRLCDALAGVNGTAFFGLIGAAFDGVFFDFGFFAVPRLLFFLRPY